MIEADARIREMLLFMVEQAIWGLKFPPFITQPAA
jgi:hypothetical protein